MLSQEHFDFVALRFLLLSSHLQDLKEVSFTVSSHFTFIAGDAQPSLWEVPHRLTPGENHRQWPGRQSKEKWWHLKIHWHRLKSIWKCVDTDPNPGRSWDQRDDVLSSVESAQWGSGGDEKWGWEGDRKGRRGNGDGIKRRSLGAVNKSTVYWRGSLLTFLKVDSHCLYFWPDSQHTVDIFNLRS